MKAMKAVMRHLSPSPQKKKALVAGRGSAAGSDSSSVNLEGAPKYDLCIFGATGFTGRLCAAYVASRHADKVAKFTWAIAGRSQDKLEEVMGSLSCANLPEIVIADSSDFASVHDMCRDTFVILNCAGPFERYGTPVVEACAELGTNYCDITGEVHWVKMMEERYGEMAAKSGALIIPMCGFDSVPSDIGTFMVALHMAEVVGQECASVKVFHHDMRGMMSGGTAHTMLGVFNRPVKDLVALAPALDLYCLNPRGGWRGGDSELFSESHVPWFDLDMMMFTMPCVLTQCNSRVVRKSAGVLSYGSKFRYSEVFAAEWNPYDIGMGIAFWLMPYVMMVAAFFPPFRWFLTNFVLPNPGQGPTPQMIENGRFRVTLVGRTATPA
eukprot:CAMPEP_0173378836 /NCGR_PEP_ID=MMETSP1356-20130122/1953_1 /TAXON_ID=77927 ORGANISM="Hemiselmis virescens, Strain PCC157" /NCGR_SAMPLE_ID=MMETSP1356 /ASSEMBLY_ACC=CAM_ASM_000847 /LENGTH=381 /DNA_ID=CAMNT_0014332039 /DNA_START=33 /DNA_END=1174 /DNA_ORIENTATION=-